MTYKQICSYEKVNQTEQPKVDALVTSIEQNGWVGMPILVCGESLVTGSHRIAALNKIEKKLLADEYDMEMYVKMDALISDTNIADDISEIVDNYVAIEEENGGFYGLPYDNLSALLARTEYEAYKDELEEW